MPTMKIQDLPDAEMCTSTDHEPDQTGLDPGMYRHVCPSCRDTRVFKVNGPRSPENVTSLAAGLKWSGLPKPDVKI